MLFNNKEIIMLRDKSTSQKTLLATSLYLLGLVGMSAHGAKAESLPITPIVKQPTNYSQTLSADFPKNVYFGDTHLHTTYSTDAGLVGSLRTPDDAYRFAKGEEVLSSTGTPAKLYRPLDFLVVTDHAENMGLPVALREQNAALLAEDFGRKVYDLASTGKVENMIKAYSLWQRGGLDKARDPLGAASEPIATDIWSRVTGFADQHYQPGVFTSFIGFEWTLAPGGSNLHRNVIFKDNADYANQIIPFSAYQSKDPKDLWLWMAEYEQNTGGKLLALAHNGNLSNGLMFSDKDRLTGEPITAEYATLRARWEPMYEVTQIKGDGEAHPLLSPNDEYADYGTWDNGSFGPEPKTQDMLTYEYARDALQRGMALEASLGVNPFKFGMVGSTDSHTALSTAEEDNFFGKVTATEPGSSFRVNEPITGRPGSHEVQQDHSMALASGLAAVWARENTREAIFEAMQRKEVYATTGSRIRLRLFGGFDYTQEDFFAPDFDRFGYQKGVPMGGDLSKASGDQRPILMIHAERDPDGANLDRVQVIKGYIDAAGQMQERIYDVALAGGRLPDDDGRNRQSVGNTVNEQEATYQNTIGAPVLRAYWQDPEFDPAQRAFYYVRVLEIPKPRWTAYDRARLGTQFPEGTPMTTVDRAYSSPIWYTP